MRVRARKESFSGVSSLWRSDERIQRDDAEKQWSFLRKVACFGGAAEEFFRMLSEGASMMCKVFTARGF